MKPQRRKTSGAVDADDLLNIVGHIYEAALDLNHWAHAMGEISHAAGAHRALMFVPDLNANGFWAAHDISPDMMSGYNEHYRNVDLWTNRCKPVFARNGSTALSEMVVPENEYLRSEFWNDFTRPADIFRLAGVAVDIREHAPETGTLLMVYRPRDSRPFDDKIRDLLRTLQPHILRSLTIGKLAASATAQHRYLEAMLNAIPSPVFACSANARIVYANSTAEELLREADGLTAEGHTVATPSPSTTQALRRAIAQASRVNPSNPATAGTTLTLNTATGSRMTVNVASLPKSIGGLDGLQGTALVIVQRGPHSGRLAKALSTTYGLTCAEVRLVKTMMNGGALPEVASRLGIAHTTARTHLKSVFQKTQTHRQAELLQLMQTIE